LNVAYLYDHSGEVGAPKWPALRQTFFSSGLAGSTQFRSSFDEDCNWIILFGGNSVPEVVDRFPKSHRLCVLMENPAIWRPSDEYLSQMGIIICPFDIPISTGTTFIKSHAAVPWFYGMKFRTDVGLSHEPILDGYMELQDLAVMSKPVKTKKLSCIVSQKIITPGQLWRVQLALKLQELAPDLVDLWGFGWKPIADKRDAIDPYEFTLVVENSPSEHYWTEKLSDALLGYAIPIYAGASNVSHYFPAGIYEIDYGRDIEFTARKVISALEQKIDRESIFDNRLSLLRKYNLYYLLDEIIT
jgi:hypothetical protein